MISRVGPALSRRIRLIWLRLRFPQVQWGARCDVRRGLRLRILPGGTVKVGSESILDHDLTIECGGNLEIGRNVIFGHHCTVAVSESVTIGDDSLVAEFVSIRDHDHCFDDLSVPTRLQGNVSAPIRIGRNVWLGAKVTVLRGVTIGDNTIVGANAVVTKDLPANCIAVGVPAKVVRMRE